MYKCIICVYVLFIDFRLPQFDIYQIFPKLFFLIYFQLKDISLKHSSNNIENNSPAVTISFKVHSENIFISL